MLETNLRRQRVRSFVRQIEGVKGITLGSDVGNINDEIECK
jgi:hypothetical protein